MNPGLYQGVPFDEYLHWPLMSQSVLKQGRLSMAHLKAAFDGIREVTATDAMMQGTALHTAFLEPERFNDEVVEWDGQRRAGAVWEAFKAAHEGWVILTSGYYAGVVGMVAALRRHPEVAAWSKQITDVELGAVGEIDGVMCRGRCDAITAEPVIDIKKVADASDRAIGSMIYEYGYHIQAYIYQKLFNRNRFILCLVEDEPPYDVRVIELGPEWMRVGKLEATDLLRRWKACNEAGVWPGRSDELEVVEPPAWVTDKFGDLVLLGGKQVF